MAVTFAQRQQLDHLCLVPRIIPGSYMENGLTTFFAMVFTAGQMVWLTATRFPLAYAGIGAFNMVRTNFYRKAGGHDRLRLNVLDDVKLGKLMKDSGGRCLVLNAQQFVSVRWQDSLWEVIRGLEKNAFASIGYSVPVLLILTFTWLVWIQLPYVALLAPTFPAASGWIATVLMWHLTFGYAGHAFGAGWRVFPLFPIASTLMMFTWWRSSMLALSRRGIVWRGTQYSLAELRSDSYR